MQHVHNDPELAQEMVQLLGNELKTLRKRVHELEDGSAVHVLNKALEEENAQLKQKLRNPNGLKQDHEEGPSQVQLVKVLKSCHDLESENEQLKNEIEYFRLQLETVTGEKNALSESLEQAMNEPTSCREEFDLEKFFKNPALSGADPLQEPIECCKKAFNDLKNSGGEAWDCADKDALWGPAGFGHCVVPFAQYSFDDKNTSIELSKLEYQVGDTKSLFRGGSSTKLFYLGTYKCVKFEDVDLASIYGVNKECAMGLLRRAVGNQKLLPPLIVEFVKSLYKTGALKLQCAVLQYVGLDDVVRAQVARRGFKTPSSAAVQQKDPSTGHHKDLKGKKRMLENENESADPNKKKRDL